MAHFKKTITLYRPNGAIQQASVNWYFCSGVQQPVLKWAISHPLFYLFSSFQSFAQFGIKKLWNIKHLESDAKIRTHDL